MPLFESFGISASGMTANRLWLDLISNDIANFNTAGVPGDPSRPVYRRNVPVFSELLTRQAGTIPGEERYVKSGVHVPKIIQDFSEPRMVLDPSHPYANQEGYVAYPNINIANEMVNMIAAARAYDANATVFEAGKSMAARALDLIR
ncbi:flagellar basal-body rod protein FlgC [Desulfocucumis palustris]|uniref:Flagellar basal-body rod protein FlgC n=1 Tax=Desulfocucumis palustris TaxID=1898651 RepID=A0A2L2XG28_9FIRM|nr:flagellar basal body rod protein FlgC [Desulfocucumis palustris]GBF33186.1 flagellar basal-body rod protein FlgC [Desulfocucumis palustris]